MTHFNESSDYWGDRVQKVIGASNGRLTTRSVKIFADGKLADTLTSTSQIDSCIIYAGALRTGGAAVGILVKSRFGF
jgi:hypothetical protein